MAGDGTKAVDIHAHFYPQAFLNLIEEEGGPHGATCTHDAEGRLTIDVGAIKAGPVGSKFIDLEQRIAAMDEQGVDIHALSLTMPMVYWAGRDFSRRLSESFNDCLAAAHESYPDRLVGLAILPMHEPDLAVKEVERASKLPGMRGFYMSTRILDRDLSHESFFPVYERIEALGLPIFLHPVTVPDAKRLSTFYLINLLGNPFESAIAAAHLIFGGVLDRFPRLDICLPHAGGAFPYLVGRLHRGWEIGRAGEDIEQGPMDYLRRFHYDTVGHSADALDYLIKIVGPDRVMLGSDYCFGMGYDRPVEVITNQPGLSEEDKALILGGNAKRLLT